MAYGAPGALLGTLAAGRSLRGGRYLTALGLGLLVSGCVLTVLAPLVYLYRDPDSSFYLEAARSLLGGQGLSVSAGLETLPLATEPLALWPPGFPLLVAGVSAGTGLDPFWAAPILSWLSWALVPAALMFAFRGLLSDRSILVVAALAMVSPGAIDFAWQPMTDMPFLLLSILSLGLVIRGSDEAPRLHLLVAAGALAGVAYAVRNAGVSLAAAVAGAYGLLVLLRLLPFRSAALALFAWGAGFGLVLAPLLLHNLAVFGALQPYQMAPSTLGLAANLRYLAAALANDLAAVHGLIDALAWRDGFLVAGAAASGLAIWTLRGRLAAAWRETPGRGQAAAVHLLCYAAATAAVVVAARTRYEWGEFIGLRHVLQIDWILLAAGAWLVERGPALRRPGALVVNAVLAALLVTRTAYAGNEIMMARQEARAAHAGDLASLQATGSDYRFRLAVKRVLAQDDELAGAIASLPRQILLASNYDDVVRVATGRPAYAVSILPACDLRQALGLGEGPAPLGLRLLVFPRRDLIASGCWKRLREADTGAGLGVSRPYMAELDTAELATLLD